VATGHPRTVRDAALVTDLLARGRSSAPADVDAPAEASFLVTGADGLRSGVLLGQRAPEQAMALIDHQLERLFTVTTRGPEPGGPGAGGFTPPATP
jgi:hypothetical protein